MSGPPVAFFDFDGTLTRGDTLMPFLHYVVGSPTYYARLIQVSPVLTGYFLKLVRNDIAKEWVLRCFLRGYPLDQLRHLGEQFSKEVIPGMLRQNSLDQLRWHQAQGHQCVLVSASLDIYLEKWANDVGFDNLLCSQIDHQNGRITGKIRGGNCFGKRKVTLIKEWLANRPPAITYGYGDSSGDRYMLEYVDHGFMLKNNQLHPLFVEG